MSKQNNRILFAIGNEVAEAKLSDKIQSNNKNDIIVGAVVHKGAILENIQAKRPNVLVLIESLPGSEDVFDLMTTIRTHFPEVRIVFITSKRDVGDLKLANLVGFAVYDIISGVHVSLSDIYNKIIEPTSFKEASKYLPKKEALFNKDDINNDSVNVEGNDDNDVADTDKIISEVYVEEENESKQISNENKEKKPVSLVDKVARDKEKKELSHQGKSHEVNKSNTIEIDNQDNNQIENTQQSGSNNVNIVATNEDVMKDIDDLIKNIPEKDLVVQTNDNNVDSFFKNGQMSMSGSKQKIVTFFSPTNGVGTTVVALNTAIELSNRGHKVIYIELNDKNPKVGYWYDMQMPTKGIESAILGLETQSYNDIKEAIITKERLLSFTESPMHDNYHKFAPNLDYLFFSDSYIRRVEKSKINNGSLKDLLMFLMYQMGYDYIVLDVNSNIDNHLIETSLIFSMLNAILFTQDVATIGEAMKLFSTLSRKGLAFQLGSNNKSDNNAKNLYIINRYFKSVEMNEKKIRQWIESSRTATVPENTKEINSSTYHGFPVMLISKNKEFKQAIKNIANTIER